MPSRVSFSPVVSEKHCDGEVNESALKDDECSPVHVIHILTDDERELLMKKLRFKAFINDFEKLLEPILLGKINKFKLEQYIELDLCNRMKAMTIKD